MIVAIDGPAGSGKSSTARLLARRLGLIYLDTGAMYRAVALLFIRNDIDPDTDGVEQFLAGHSIRIESVDDSMHVFIDADDVTSHIRTARVTELSSRISALAFVRTKLVAEQRRIAELQVSSGSGVVMEGRDIGTVVFPDADIKFFLVATPEERAKRRVRQVISEQGQADYGDILAGINARDNRDETRSVSPLKKAHDAIEVDTTNLSFDDQVHLLEGHIRERE